ncbi:MAG: cell division protein ZapA [Desulfobacterales bacterium]|nr:cell division protein ZapA [Desulfobacterales bacterium]MDJ0911953.1 cell division protein ZapA [Desulfobacterales bacterium]
MEQLITINLFGQPYTFKTESEFTKAKEVADLLVKEVTRVESQQPGESSGITKQAVLILAALNIANQNIELKQSYSEFMSVLSEKSSNLIHSLDTTLGSEKAY